MNKSLKLYSLTALTLLIGFFVGIGCTDDVVVAGDDDPTITNTNTYLSRSLITATHIVNTTRCPQELDEVAVTTTDLPEGKPDSVVVTLNSTSLDAFFPTSGERTIVPSAHLESEVVRVFFTCASQEDVDGKLTFSFYVGGKIVATETVAVKIDVN